jgi:hypothetical protein
MVAAGSGSGYRSGGAPVNCRASHPVDRVSAWVDPGGANAFVGATGPQGAHMDQERLWPGDDFTCTIPILAPQQTGNYEEYFAPVAEGKAWMFNNGSARRTAREKRSAHGGLLGRAGRTDVIAGAPRLRRELHRDDVAVAHRVVAAFEPQRPAVAGARVAAGVE